MADFDSICEWALKFEDSTLSGKVEVLNDGAGATRFGIASHEHPELGGPASHFYACPAAEALGLAKGYYRAWYWNSFMDQVADDGVASVLFDFSVNSGQSRAVKVLQGLLNVQQDGDFGYHTLQAVNAYPGSLAAQLRAARAAWVAQVAQDHPNDAPYLKGWLRRAAAVFPNGNGVF
jgi:lysozyme family protein